jgi:hypothetical protein
MYADGPLGGPGHLDLTKETAHMIQPEGPTEPEIVETDLSQEEGMPTERGSTPLAGGGLGQAQEGSGPQAGGGGPLSDISFLFRLPGMRVQMRNRSSDASPTHRALAVSLPIAVSFIAAIAFAKLFLGTVDSLVAIGVILLIVMAGFYLALRVIAEPVPRRPRRPRRPRKGRNA